MIDHSEYSDQHGHSLAFIWQTSRPGIQMANIFLDVSLHLRSVQPHSQNGDDQKKEIKKEMRQKAHGFGDSRTITRYFVKYIQKNQGYVTGKK